MPRAGIKLGIAAAALLLLSWQAIRNHRRTAAQAVSLEVDQLLSRVAELRKRARVGDLNNVQLQELEAAEKFVDTHPQARPLANLARSQMLAAEAFVQLGELKRAGLLLQHVRNADLDPEDPLPLATVHTLLAEVAAPHPHLEEFARLHASTATRILSDLKPNGQSSSETGELSIRLAAVGAVQARNHAAKAWMDEESRLMEASREARAQARKLSTDLQKEMTDAVKALEEQAKTATDANDPAQIEKLAKARLELEGKFSEKLSMREQQLREQLTKSFEPSPALLQVRQAWLMAANEAAKLAVEPNTMRLLALAEVLAATLSFRPIGETLAVATELEKLVQDRLAADPDNRWLRHAAARALHSLAERAWLLSRQPGESHEQKLQKERDLKAAAAFAKRSWGLVGDAHFALRRSSQAMLDSLEEATAVPADQRTQFPRLPAATNAQDLLSLLQEKEGNFKLMLLRARKQEDKDALQKGWDAAIACRKAAEAWHAQYLATALLAQNPGQLPHLSSTMLSLCKQLPEAENISQAAVALTSR